MILPPLIIDGEELPSNIIVLHAAIRSYTNRECKHTAIIVDAELAQVICKNCEKLLDPLAILSRFAKEQNLWWHRAQEYSQKSKELVLLEQELADKQRCKCEHCKKMTRIDRRVPSLRLV